MATFPSYVKLLAEGFSKDRPTAIQRTQMEDGMVKQLKYRSRVLVTRHYTAEVQTKADYDSFLVFYKTTINSGADFFTWTDPEDSVSKLGRIVSKINNETPVFGTSRWRFRIDIEVFESA